MADYDFEAWAQSRVASSKPKPKPSPGQQAAKSMLSVGIGGLGGRTTTSAAQRIQDQFNMFRDDDDRGSTYDYVPQTVTSGLGTPLSFVETEKKDDRNLDQKIYDGMKAFGARLFPPKKESPSAYVLDVYETSPMFRIPTVPEVTELGIGKTFGQKLQEMFDSQGQNVYTPEIEGTDSYDEVPAPSTNKNLMRNRINKILKDVIAPNSKEYEIQKGDTLSDISLREGVSVEDLAKVNEIENPNLILAGGTLIIPPVQEMEKAKEYVLRVTTRGDENLVPDPERQFYQSGVPMDQRDFAPELGYDEIPLPSEATVDKKIKGLGARPEVTVTELDAAGVTTDDDMGLPSTRSETETIMALEPMFEFIQEGEGDYNSSNRGTIGKKIIGSTNNTTRDGKSLTEMTIGEIQTKQAITDPNNTERLFAVGRFQTIPTTLAMAVDALNLSDDTVFNEDTQNKIGKYLITQKREQVGRYLEGSSTVSQDRAMLELAKEFASFPVPYDMTVRRNGKDVKLKKGDSYYGSGNKAQHTVDEVKDELDKLRGNI